MSYKWNDSINKNIYKIIDKSSNEIIDNAQLTLLETKMWLGLLQC